MRLDARPVFLTVVGVLLAIAFLEVALGLLALVSARVDELLASPWAAIAIPAGIADPRLGSRPNPAYPGHDRKGFRNPGVPIRADIVALGDSQTYGTGVKAREAWPRRLESITGKKVYSMAFGGYGPGHSLMIWDEAVALQPNIIVEAFYSGNDLFDSFDVVYNNGQLPHLKSPDPRLQQSVHEAEQSDPIKRRVEQMFQEMYRTGAAPVAAGDKAPAGTRDGLSLRGLVSEYSRIYGLGRRVWYETTRGPKWERARAFRPTHPECCQVFDDGRFRTVFTSEYRLAALDLEDPRIAEGLQISLRAIRAMHELAAARDIRFLVVMIPTKELVFRELWRTPSGTFQKLTQHEERFGTIAKAYFENAGIEYLDSLSALRGQLAAGIQPFFASLDGHLNEHGQSAVAKLVAEHLASPRAMRAESPSGAVSDAARSGRPKAGVE